VGRGLWLVRWVLRFDGVFSILGLFKLRSFDDFHANPFQSTLEHYVAQSVGVTAAGAGLFWVLDALEHRAAFMGRNGGDDGLCVLLKDIGKFRVNPSKRANISKNMTTGQFKEILGEIKISDITRLVLKHSEYPRSFKKFVALQPVVKFLNYLVIYFENFLKIFEYLLIRHDICKQQVKIKNLKSANVESNLSTRLQFNRIKLAQKYAEILIGHEELRPHHHMANKLRLSQQGKDLALQENLLKFCKHFTWIAHFRRARGIIDGEIDRLFRSKHFQSCWPHVETQRLTFRDRQILYGIHEVEKGSQMLDNSPVVKELMRIAPQHLSILRIGDVKYMGGNRFLKELELEYVTPPEQLALAHVTHGILGKPKQVFDENLQIDWCAVRDEGYCEAYDPYHLVRQVFVPTTAGDLLPAGGRTCKPRHKIKVVHK
jgi:Protein phosphatase 1 inhibitor